MITSGRLRQRNGMPRMSLHPDPQEWSQARETKSHLCRLSASVCLRPQAPSWLQ
jgi:hypothetical protein